MHFVIFWVLFPCFALSGLGLSALVLSCFVLSYLILSCIVLCRLVLSRFVLSDIGVVIHDSLPFCSFPGEGAAEIGLHALRFLNLLPAR